MRLFWSVHLLGSSESWNLILVVHYYKSNQMHYPSVLDFWKINELDF